MARFTVVQDTDGTYEDAVRSLWQRYLPGTPGARYPWMAAGNPAGRSDWLVALAGESGEVAGVLSIMPRFFWRGGKRLRAGILGDFMVEKKHRLYGPTLLLPGKAGEWQAALGYDVLYTVPNREAVRVIVRAGLQDTIRVRHYARPLSSRYYVEKRLGGIWAAPAAASSSRARRQTSGLVRWRATWAAYRSSILAPVASSPDRRVLRSRRWPDLVRDSMAIRRPPGWDAQDDIAVHFRAAEGAGFSGAQLFSGDRNL